MNNVVEADGLKWYVGDNSTDDHLALGGHETALGPIMIAMSDPDKDFVNIGAHVGTWALRMAPYNRYVYAVEGNPLTADRLMNNVTLNELDDQVSVMYACLWDKAGEIVQFVDVNGKATGGSTRAQETDQLDYEAPGSTITHTLDNIGFSNVGLIVMDVEGAEARILRGGFNTINTQRPNMIIELHDGHPGTDPDLREQVYGLLNDLNYVFNSVDITGERLLCYPAERQPQAEPEVVKAG